MPESQDIHSALDREVYCILGIPFDAISLEQASDQIKLKARHKHHCFLSTPNLNWLRIASKNHTFRDSALFSDLVVADGMPVVWLANLMGIPIFERVAGSDLINNLEHTIPGEPLRVFFFGGEGKAAHQAMQNINLSASGLQAVGALNPGFGSIDEMSTPEIINTINQAKADFLIVSLGSLKGQHWIMHNQSRLNTPIISHLGAVVNFYAKTVARAPKWIASIGMEWLWRIYQEPKLYSRYAGDALYLLSQFFTKCLPYRLFQLTNAPSNLSPPLEQDILTTETPTQLTLQLKGTFVRSNLQDFKHICANAIAGGKSLEINLSTITYFDPAMTGTLMILKKLCREQERSFKLVTPNKVARRILKLLGSEHLLGNY